VVVSPVELREFRDTVEAIGTARARESAELTAKLTETVRRIHFEDGERVEQGQLLVELTRSEEGALLGEARAELQNAQTELERHQALNEENLVSGIELDRRQHAVRLARARLSTVQARLADRVIVAPFEGLVGLRNVSVGSIVRPDTVVATIDDVGVIKLDFPVPETELDGLEPGLEVAAHSSAFPDRDFSGKVTGLDTRVDPATRSIVVRAEIPNPRGELRPGMLLKVEVIRDRRQSRSVPSAALVPVGEQQHVYVLVEGGTVDRVPVTIGQRTPRFVEVTEGLDVGDEVVVHGTIKLRPGARVKVRRGGDA
jgi:membrane fusion protein (multidrug efflux system)